MDWDDEDREDGESAHIYNFKDKETCPMCKYVDMVFDHGGDKLVKDRYGFSYNEHFHGALGCYWQYLYYSACYDESDDEEPDIDELKLIAISNFKLLADVTGDTFFLKEADRPD